MCPMALRFPRAVVTNRAGSARLFVFLRSFAFYPASFSGIDTSSFPSLACYMALISGMKFAGFFVVRLCVSGGEP